MRENTDELAKKIDRFLAEERKKNRTPVQGSVQKGFRLPADLVADLRNFVTELKNRGIKTTEKEVVAEAIRDYLKRQWAALKEKGKQKKGKSPKNNKALP